MRKFNFLWVALLLQASTSFGAGCRDAVVDAHLALGTIIERDSFSNAEFKDLAIEVEEFNNMDSEEQERIYIQIRPMRIMVDITILNLNRKIGRYAGTFYEMYVLDKLELWRNSIDELKSCDYQE